MSAWVRSADPKSEETLCQHLIEMPYQLLDLLWRRILAQTPWMVSSPAWMNLCVLAVSDMVSLVALAIPSKSRMTVREIGRCFLAAMGNHLLLSAFLFAFCLVVDLPPAPPQGPQWLEFGAQLLLSLIAYDFLEYGLHRLLHHPRLLWIHRVHHQFQRPTAIATFYQHPIEFILQSAIAVLPGLAFGLHPFVTLIFTLMLAVHGCLSHLGVRGWPTPAPFVNLEYHYQHHLYHNVNYGAWTFWPDRLFGTEYRGGAASSS